jgi:regulator of cell morphogenesis and NO signaling
MNTSGFASGEVETTGLAAEERIRGTLSAFDSLAPGERFLLRGETAPRQILESLQTQRPGLFEWSVLANGSSGPTIEIFRRDAPSGSLREITETLAWDHDRLDALEADAFLALSRGDLPEAVGRYAQFACGLERHIGFEEDLLFPVFEQKMGMDGTCGPTAVMRQEHAEIRFLLGSIAGSLGQSAEEVASLRRRFHEVIGEHNEKEEAILYPASDRMLSPRESDELVARIQRYGC